MNNKFRAMKVPNTVLNPNQYGYRYSLLHYVFGSDGLPYFGLVFSDNIPDDKGRFTTKMRERIYNEIIFWGFRKNIDKMGIDFWEKLMFFVTNEQLDVFRGFDELTNEFYTMFDEIKVDNFKLLEIDCGR